MDKRIPSIVGKTLGISGLVLATFFWGSTFILVKETVSIAPVDGFLVIRFGLAALIMLVYTLSRPDLRSKVKNRSVLAYGTILGTLLYLSFWFQTEGLVRTTPAKAAFITGMNVVLVPVFAFLIFRARYDIKDVVLSILAFIGLGFVSLDPVAEYLINFGDSLVIVTAVCIALHILYTEQANHLDLTALLTVQLLVISIEASIVAAVRSAFWLPLTTNLIIWLTILVTVVFATIYAFAIQIYAQQQDIPAAYIAIIFTLEPVFALVIDILIGATPNIWESFGMGLILIATLSLSIRTRKDDFEDQPQVLLV